MCLFLQDESRRSQDSLWIGGLDSPSKVVKEFSFKCKHISLTDRAVPMLKLLNFKLSYIYDASRYLLRLRSSSLKAFKTKSSLNF